MSIFPKRTVPGGSVTIHWHLGFPANMDKPLCPFARIGIVGPDGSTTLLFEQHVQALPGITSTTPQAPKTNTPLLVLASYLSGKQSREKLVGILNNIQYGRHYYFSWAVPAEALPGKYTLLSELHIDGRTVNSGTATEDFFLVEQLTVQANTNATVSITNHGPVPVPAKLVYYPQKTDAISIPPNDSYHLRPDGQAVFLVYNEDRITLPLHALQQKRALRNQYHLAITKQSVLYVLPKEGDDAYILNELQKQIWEAADGINTTEAVKEIDPIVYDNMLAHQLITEIP